MDDAQSQADTREDSVVHMRQNGWEWQKFGEINFSYIDSLLVSCSAPKMDTIRCIFIHSAALHAVNEEDESSENSRYSTRFFSSVLPP